jgi:hypothetical protein
MLIFMVVTMVINMWLTLYLLAITLLLPDAVRAQASQDGRSPSGTTGGTLLNGTTEAQPHGEWSGTYQNIGVNLMSARRTKDGFLVRVKRRIKPGGDSAKEFARNIPVVSTAANWATLGLFKRALKSDGEAVRATWLVMNCTNKTFNVSSDGYSWQNIYKDPYGQAEDLYFQLCESNQKDVAPRYLNLPPAEPEMLRAAQAGK